MIPSPAAHDRTGTSRVAELVTPAWAWPLDLGCYDRAAALTAAERAALHLLGDEARGWWFRPARASAFACTRRATESDVRCPGGASASADALDASASS